MNAGEPILIEFKSDRQPHPFLQGNRLLSVCHEVSHVAILPHSGSAYNILVQMRINRALASLGYGSRRAVEELIVAGKVQVNGEVVTSLSAQADPEKDKIAVAGRRAPAKIRTRILAFYKPRGVLSTCSDERGRKCLTEFFPAIGDERVFAVGRLDKDSEGLLIITNDGDLANRLMHPSSGVVRTYEITADPAPLYADIERLAGEVVLDDGIAKPLSVRPHPTRASDGVVMMSLNEGRNRIVRRIFTKHGFEVKRLKRIEFGGVGLGSLKAGDSRRVTQEEEAWLRKSAGLAAGKPR